MSIYLALFSQPQRVSVNEGSDNWPQPTLYGSRLLPDWPGTRMLLRRPSLAQMVYVDEMDQRSKTYAPPTAFAQDRCVACLSTNFCCFNAPSSLQAIKSKRAFQKSAARGQRRSEGWPENFRVAKACLQESFWPQRPSFCKSVPGWCVIPPPMRQRQANKSQFCTWQCRSDHAGCAVWIGLVGGARLGDLLGRCTTSGSVSDRTGTHQAHLPIDRSTVDHRRLTRD